MFVNIDIHRNEVVVEHVDVAVIGGGRAGLAAAHALAGQGRTSMVLEASGSAAGSWPECVQCKGAPPPCRARHRTPRTRPTRSERDDLVRCVST
ncbi:FAD-binding protein [Streptomyces avidinii]|uniref:NAD(P)-binding protein n=1 Tax=Streptomyces avidinii TaxID=1895 RepID=UPI00386E9D0B|nr:FAD-binding protein [Streptomyces avidinii]